MTTSARKVLADCRVALRLLEDETQEDVWRVHWAGALGLIRAVGSVLDKTDGKSILVKRVSDDCYKSWKNKQNSEHEIFRDFIKKERDFYLHEYETSVDLRKEVTILVASEKPAYLPPNAPNMSKIAATEFKLDQNIFRPLADGPWAGEDVRDVYEMALDWWQEQLDSIDEQVAREQKLRVPN